MKVFRDPVHNLITFDRESEDLILKLIDTKEMQRLRRIKQLGLSSFTYPGAEHSRFAHSLGVTHLTKRMIERISYSRDEQEIGWYKSIKDNYILALCAALLHDVGHGPFSHAIEKTIGIEHEKWTIQIITSETEVKDILEGYKEGFSQEVAEVIKRVHPSKAIVKLLSSQLDADRIDYLMRDSIMTGAGYGRFDLEWLLNVIKIGQVNEPEIGLSLEKGLSIAEDFVMARYYMYKNVYFHKATRSAEVIINKIFERVKLLNSENKLDIPLELKNLLISDDEKLDNIDDYLQLDDHYLWYCFSLWSKSSDSVLADLCSRIMKRNLLKSISIDGMDLNKLMSNIYTLKEEASKSNPLLANLVYTDTPATSCYKDNYILSSVSNNSEAQEEASEQIFLFDKNNKAYELSTVSEIINTIRNKPLQWQRLYYPKELKEIVQKVFD